MLSWWGVSHGATVLALRQHWPLSVAGQERRAVPRTAVSSIAGGSPYCGLTPCLCPLASVVPCPLSEAGSKRSARRRLARRHAPSAERTISMAGNSARPLAGQAAFVTGGGGGIGGAAGAWRASGGAA